ncbi:MAG: aminotransferase class I/II-fold pyridoxal phosphate-dependent enzyme [Mogibacterium sp.]|nr:aminotransferase class I/II-fold pyridoxal phosphate-dependent enzyme [Mogibacterium sp.]
MDFSDNGNGIEALHGGDVYRNDVRLDFSVNLNPYPMPQEVIDAMQAGLAEMHQYPDPAQQKLRERIAVLEGVDIDNVVCGNGASELLMAAVHAVMPRKALIAAPCYAGYAVALQASDAAVTEYLLDEKGDFAVDEGILDQITDDIEMVFIADPNNPNGRLIEPELKREIIRKCEECGAVLIIDECFYPLTGAEGGTFTDNALHLRAFTKTFAIPGIRIGYMISRNETLLGKIRKHLPEWNVSRIAERTGETAARVLASTDYLSSSVHMIKQEREYLAGQFERLGLKVYRSDTNYLLIKSRPDLYERLLGKGILIRRCANFSGLDETYFRIAVRQHKDNEELINILGKVL